MGGLKEISKFILDQIDHNRECGKDDEITLEEIASIIARRVLGEEGKWELRPIIRYSREPFEWYTHRFLVHIDVKGHCINMTLYSNNESFKDAEDYLRERLIAKNASFTFTHRATREQDESDARIIDEMMSKE